VIKKPQSKPQQTALISFRAANQAPMLVACKLLQARELFGRTEYLVEPIAGQGAQWVNENRVVPKADTL